MANAKDITAEDKAEFEKYKAEARKTIAAEVKNQLAKIRQKSKSSYQKLLNDVAEQYVYPELRDDLTLRKIRTRKTSIRDTTGNVESKCIALIHTPPKGEKITSPDYFFVYSIKENVVKSLLTAYGLNEYQKCLTLATFFFTLVANTPMDEDYTGKRTVQYGTAGRVSLKGSHPKIEIPTSGDAAATDEELLERARSQFEVKTKEITVKHKADECSVRGDWILKYKGCNFKAFKTQEEEGSSPLPSKLIYFQKDWFLTTSFRKNESYIDEMANLIYEATKKSKAKSDTFVYENVNPRTGLLEYGGYSNGTSAPIKGSKYGYKHGVKDNFTYQAPMGFIRMTEEYWATIKKTWSKKNPLMNKRRPLNVSKLKSKVVRDIFATLKSNPREINSKLLDEWITLGEL